MFIFLLFWISLVRKLSIFQSPLLVLIDLFLDDREEKNIFEAAAVGAAMSIGPIANITVMMMAFVSLVSLLNAILSWLGSMVALPELSFEVILL